MARRAILAAERGNGLVKWWKTRRFRTVLLVALCWVLVLGGMRLCVRLLPSRDGIRGEEGRVWTALSVTEACPDGQSTGGYAAAYLLRADGRDITGAEVSAELPGRIPGGEVLPQGLRLWLEGQGYRVQMRSGEPEQLCARLAEGLPVIALIREEGVWRYVAVVGCDADSLYLADPGRLPDEGYNRVVSREEFSEMQQVGLLWFDEMYLTVTPEKP